MVNELSIMDWIMLVLTLLSMLMAWLRGLQRLHPEARKWLSCVGEPLIRRFASEAAAMVDLTPQERRACVVERLRKAVLEIFDLEIPESIANYLVEHVYQSIKGGSTDESND